MLSDVFGGFKQTIQRFTDVILVCVMDAQSVLLFALSFLFVVSDCLKERVVFCAKYPNFSEHCIFPVGSLLHAFSAFVGWLRL